MGDIITALQELQNTPVPTILVAGGIVFLFLAVVGQFVGQIQVPPERQKWAGIIGVLLLFSGVALYVAPGPPSVPTPTVVAAVTPIKLTPIATLAPEATEIPARELTSTPKLASPTATSTVEPISTNTPIPISPEAQQVAWGPSLTPVPREAGICIINNCTEFIPWERLKDELEQQLLPQVSRAPRGSTVALKDYQGRRDWIVQIVDPNWNEVGHVWLGRDPYKNWEDDGLVRVGSPGPPEIVWDIFQRYSDGTYRRQ